MNLQGLVYLALSMSMMTLTKPLSTNEEEEEEGILRFGSDERTTRSYGISESLKATSLFPTRRVRHRRSRGKYTMKEEIVRRVEAIHPCGLAKTAVKVTFPGMKSEVLVSFLGYKEPNLIHVNRCKGRCGDGPDIACLPTKRKMKKIRMHLRTQVIGSDKKKDKYRELILEEHEECSCTCLTSSPSHCLSPSLFSNETCSCQCDNSQYRRERLDCEDLSAEEMAWDAKSCSCRRKVDIINNSLSGYYPEQTVQSRTQGDATTYSDAHDATSFFHNNEIALDSRCAHCLDCMNKAGILSVYRNQRSPLFESWSLLVICSLLISVFFSTTLYYWKKSRKLLSSLSGKGEQPLADHCSSNGNNVKVNLPFSPSLPSEHAINFDHNGDGSMLNHTYMNSSLNSKSPELNNGRCKGGSLGSRSNNTSDMIATVEDYRSGGRSSSECRRKNNHS